MLRNKQFQASIILIIAAILIGLSQCSSIDGTRQQRIYKHTIQSDYINGDLVSVQGELYIFARVLPSGLYVLSTLGGKYISINKRYVEPAQLIDSNAQ